MNNRAIEIYKQASEFAYSSIDREFWNTLAFQGVVTGKFAELMIQECLETIEGCSMNSNDEWEDGLTIASNAVKQHFGVDSEQDSDV